MHIGFTEPLLQRLENINIDNPEELDEIIQTISNQYVNSTVSHSTNPKNAKNKQKITKDKAWYTNDCKEMKRRLNQVKKLLEKNPSKQDLRALYYNTRKQYKKLVKYQRRKYEENLTHKLEHLYSNDKNAFWKHLKSMKKTTNDEALKICISSKSLIKTLRQTIMNITKKWRNPIKMIYLTP